MEEQDQGAENLRVRASLEIRETVAEPFDGRRGLEGAEDHPDVARQGPHLEAGRGR